MHRSIDIDLNAMESPAVGDKSESFDSTQSQVAIQALSVALRVAREASARRMVPFDAPVVATMPSFACSDFETKQFVDTFHEVIMYIFGHCLR